MLLKAIVAAGVRSPQVSKDQRAILLPRSEEQALASALKHLEPRLRRQIFQPLSQKSAARALGLTPAKFRQMKRDGQITSSSKAIGYRNGKRYQYPTYSVRDLLEAARRLDVSRSTTPCSKQ